MWESEVDLVNGAGTLLESRLAATVSLRREVTFEMATDTAVEASADASAPRLAGRSADLARPVIVQAL